MRIDEINTRLAAIQSELETADGDRLTALEQEVETLDRKSTRLNSRSR